MATHTTTVTIAAHAQEVFAALTQPELMQHWQFGRTAETDWQPGSAITFRNDHSAPQATQWGTVLALQPNALIRYSLFTPRPDLEDIPENYSVTEYTLTPEDGQTTVTLIQQDNRPDGFTAGSLEPILLSLKRVVETNG